MRRDQPTTPFDSTPFDSTPFDVESDDLTQQFWGASKAWVSGEQQATRRTPRSSSAPRSDDTSSLQAIRDGFAAFRPRTSPSASGAFRRQRQHGTPGPANHEAVRHEALRSDLARSGPVRSVGRREATLGELAAGDAQLGGWLVDEPDSLAIAHHQEPELDVPLTPVRPLADRLGLGAVDPLLLRAGALVMAMILLVPVLLSLRPDRDDSLPGDVIEVPVPAGEATFDGRVQAEPAVAQPTSQSVDTAAAAAVPSVDDGVPTAASTLGSDDAAGGVSTDTSIDGTVATPSGSTPVEVAVVDVVADRVVPACPQIYTAAPGDSWYRIADEAGVSPNQLLVENGATTETVILPGDDICLPAGATMPASPTTTTSPSTTTPSTTTPSITSPSTTAPVTTAPSTTAAPSSSVAPVANLSRSEVQELIRQTWPEDEVEKALAVARRESNFIATADNGWCCVGVFQIYWTVHRSWLAEFGITQRSDLYDARKNIAAAHHMWQRSGWGPWGG